MSKKENIWNVPNFLSAYRILAFPFIGWTIYAGDKHLFITMITINLITDLLDGFIARRFKLETEFGARLDSMADIGTYVMAFAGMIILEHEFVREHWIAFTVMGVLYAAHDLLALIRFKRTSSLHLYSSKIVAYIQGIFIFFYFVIGYTPWYFYFMTVAASLAYLEAIVIIAVTPELRSNVKGIYFMLKEKGKIE
jgi:cardiolipin synthase (CMP-forming)